MSDKRAFEALLDEYARQHALATAPPISGVFTTTEDYDAARAAVLQAYDAAAGREGQPVAWGSGDGHWVRAVDLPDRPDKARFTEPFYTHPAPKAEKPHRCLCCGALTSTEPSDQERPADYCGEHE